MRKIVAFMHTTLDGFVADTNGGLGWAILDGEISSFVANLL